MQSILLLKCNQNIREEIGIGSRFKKLSTLCGKYGHKKRVVTLYKKN
jgi:hypothetical protein